MGLLDWVLKSGSGKRALTPVSVETHMPCFEQLEPRVLLSADALVPHEPPLVETPFEVAIVVDLDERSQIADDSSQSIDDGYEDKKIGSEDSGTVERSESETVGQVNCHTVTRSTGLPVSQLTTVSDLITAQLLRPRLFDPAVLRLVGP